MFKIVSENINVFPPLEFIEDKSIGAFVFFQGVVRNHNEGREVLSLEYESYESMANKVGTKIVKEALELFPISHAICVHRVGDLQLGDTAVWVAVASHHRKEAFEGCEYIINKVKSEVPIWKRERYQNGTLKWVACHRCGEHNHA